MEALLPSEIARLVFGYLEDEKCDDAARSFLEVSPHLQECRTAVLSGRRFNTRVNGYNLVDIFDEFSAAHCWVQERLSKVGDCEQVRQCGDLLEQLRFLIGGSRGQRFVVNINVPSQANSQTYVGSPIITSSIRKRHHTGSDHDRTKRTQKPLHQLLEKQPEPVSSQLGCTAVEATPLESLPGHTHLTTRSQHEFTGSQDSDRVYCTSTKNDFADCLSLDDLQSVAKQICNQPSLSHQGIEQDKSSGRSERYSPVSVHGKEKMDGAYMDDEESRNSMRQEKTMATSTDELTTYSSIEVQTTPYALSESESIGLDDEPIENLSLLTKELLNRTELQERIAENINKAILPIEMPSKDESICESMGGELNTSIMAELNNAIKSIVAATETDPIFEHFLDEIIGPNVDTDTSPDEDPDVRVAAEPQINSRINSERPNTDVVNMDLEEETTVMSYKVLGSSGTAEVPLKQRLRSSSRQQNNKVEDDGNKPKEVEKKDSSLEDHNAAAILSIINANIVSEKQAMDKGTVTGNNVSGKPAAVINSTELSEADSISSESRTADSTKVVEHDRASCKSVDVPIAKKSECTKSNPEPKVDQHELITEQEMMAMPTLIVCSREEMRNCIHADTLYSSVKTVPCPEARFIPIAPKGSEVMEPPKPIYLRAVHVPIQLPKKILPASSNTEVEAIKMKPPSPPKISSTNRKRSRKVTKKSKNLKPAVIETNSVVNTESLPVVNNMNSHTELESITLYANDNSIGTLIESGNMPAISLDDSMTLSGTGLSPYLKFHDDRNLSQQSELPCEKRSSQVPTEELDTVPVLSYDENILITRRTPRSLLKSRSKHNRISMSTPRRRSSHIRALDFNTPAKSSTSEHKVSRNNSLQFSSKSSKRARSVCRTSLFKSPQFSNSITASPKIRTPIKDCQSYKVPIATRSPAPKLMGGWEKYTGVGMILGGTSPHPSSSSSIFAQVEPNSPIKSSSSTVKKSWDADLRKALQEHQQPTHTTFVTTKVAAKVKGRGVKNVHKDLVEKVLESGNSAIGCDASQHVIINQQQEAEQIPCQVGGKEVDSFERDNITAMPSGTINELETLKQVECPPVIGNSELGVSNDAQIVNAQIQSKLVLTDTTVFGNKDTKLKEKVIPETVDTNKKVERPVVKKYAKLKTLQTRISKCKESRITRSTDPSVVDSSQKKYEYLRVSPESRSQPAHISCMIDLETPRKIDNSTGIPPTPRLLSPSSSIITPFTKVPGGSSKVPSFVSTPDFPPTPSIALTPIVMGENTIDAIKRGEYGTCSPYYQPSTEQPYILEKMISGSNNFKEHVAEVIPVTFSMDMDSGTLNQSGGVTGDFVMTSSNSSLGITQLGITQFEVIKENLPKEETVKELKISTNSNNVEETLPNVVKPTPEGIRRTSESENIGKPFPIHPDSGSSSGNESNDSTSSNTISSSSYSTSCSCSSTATTSTPLKFVTKCKTESDIYKDTSNANSSSKSLLAATIHHNSLTEISPIMAPDICTASKNNQVLIAMQTASSVPKGETSPVKLLPLFKSLDEVEASAKETPAKDEALLSEANISETPSSSKSGIESLTNLNSKISALDRPGEQGNSSQSHLANKIEALPPTKTKPKIISVQRLLPDVSVALKPPLVPEMVSSTTQSFNNLSILSSVALDGKLGTQLEEKRLRLMAKLKDKPQPKVISHRATVKQLNLDAKKNYKIKHDMPKSSGHERKISASQVASQNSAMTKVNLISEKKQVNVKNTEIQNKQKSKSYSDGIKKRGKPKATLVKLSSKDKKYDECNTSPSAVKIPTCINRQQSYPVGKKDNGKSSNEKKMTRLNEQQGIQKTEERPSGDLLTPKLDLKECPNMGPAESTKTIEDLNIVRKMEDSTQTTKPMSSVLQTCDLTCAKNATKPTITAEGESPRLIPSCSEDEECAVGNIMNPIKKSQIVPMSKVDLIKRDLFSDEENNDQRTTRSRTRQLSDVQKNDPIAVSKSASQSRAKVCHVTVKKPKEELASVLECLKLVPAIKNDTVEKTSSSPKSSMNKFAEYEFVHDESIPVKKKRIRFSSSHLQYVVNVELRDENYRECPRLMMSTTYEEIFNISPKAKKRVIAKKLAMKGSQSSKLEALEAASGSGKMLKNELIKPVAPSAHTVELETQTSEVDKIILKPQHKNVKPNYNDDNKKPQDLNQVLKKRKTTNSEEDHLTEKKRRTADPQTLLKKLDLDLFLTSVHGPV